LGRGKEAAMKHCEGSPRAALSVIAVMAAAAVLLAVAVALGGLLGGCAGSAGGSATTSNAGAATSTTFAPTTTSTVAETTSTTAAKLAWGDTGKWQGISVTAAGPQTDPSPELVGEGNKVVYCTVNVANNSPDPFDYNGLDFMLFDSAHQEYDSYGLTSMPDFGEGTLAPGESLSGAVAFELPQSATPSGLEWQPQSMTAPQLIWGQP
jgi:hypothetical protein